MNYPCVCHLSEEQESVNGEALVPIDSHLQDANPLSQGIVLITRNCPQLLILGGLEKQHARTAFMLRICANS